jgi:hemerythrin-like domain-containing protein
MTKLWGITDSLRADHGELRRLIAKINDEPGVAVKHKLFTQDFLPLLESHTGAEEETLIARALTEEKLRACANEGLEEHDVAEFEAAKIKISASDDQWITRFRVLTELLEHHLDEEEKEFFPLAERVLSAEEQSELASRYSEAKDRFRLAPIIQLPLRAFAMEERTGS